MYELLWIVGLHLDDHVHCMHTWIHARGVTSFSFIDASSIYNLLVPPLNKIGSWLRVGKRLVWLCLSKMLITCITPIHTTAVKRTEENKA